MEVQSELASGEVKHLQRCINDLVSLLALPAIWSGGDPSQVLHTLLDALLRMLRLDLVCARLTVPVGEAPVEIVEIVRTAEPQESMPSAHEICEAISQCLKTGSRKWPPLLRNLMGEGDVSIVPLPVQGELGVIVAVAQRMDFPLQTEALLLSVAANQACIGLQGARLLTHQKHLADELDQQVAKRTAELAAAEERWRSVFENSAIGVALTDLSGSFFAANPVYEKMVGYTEEELQKLSFLDITYEEDLELNQMLIADLLSGKVQQFQIEKQYRRKNGSLIWVRNNVSVVPGKEQVPQFLMALSEDITERKQAEEKLRASETTLKQIINTIPTPAWSARPDGYCDFVNQRWLDYVGLSTEQGLGWGWEAAIHPDDLPGLVEYWQSCLASGMPVDTEARLRRFDGIYRWFLFRANPLRDESGNIIKWYGTHTDIDDRKRAEEALDKARSELTHVARVTSLGTLTASIAHELNQPLSGIITNASTCLRMLAADPANVDGARETARRTIRDGNRASDVITRLRALFSKKDPTIESVDLNEATREVLALSSSDFQRNRVIVQQELADGLPLVAGDRVQLQQVILNLLRNASDAMSAVDDRPRQLLVRTEGDDDGDVRLTVQDAGVGFPPEVADRLFESFHTTKNDGMGIGLSVSRSIIDSHHGRLWATLNNGPGATFSFSLPRASGGSASADSRDIRTPDVTDAA
jgi:PAS domain S-box-containing protein